MNPLDAREPQYHGKALSGPGKTTFTPVQKQAHASKYDSMEHGVIWGSTRGPEWPLTWPFGAAPAGTLRGSNSAFMHPKRMQDGSFSPHMIGLSNDHAVFRLYVHVATCSAPGDSAQMTVSPKR